MGYTYDKATGIKTYRPDNVNGCWSGDINIGAYGPIMYDRTNTHILHHR